MFKNRIRTAAIAGIAALATGLSGVVATPAIAQTDGTEAAPANPEHTEDYNLEAALDEVNEYIQGYELPKEGADFDPSEEAIAQATAEELAVAQDYLAQAVENQTIAREAALEALERWDNVVEAAQAVDAVVAENSNLLTDTDRNYVNPEDGTVASATEPTQGYNSTGDEIVIDEERSLIQVINDNANFIGAEAETGSAAPIESTVTDYDQYQDDSAESVLGNNGRVDAAWNGSEFIYENSYDNPTDQAAASQLEELEALQDELVQLIDAAAAPEGNETEANGRAFNAYYDGLLELQGQVDSAIADLEDAQDALFDAQRASGSAEAEQALGVLYDSTDQRNILRKIVNQLQASVNFMNLAVEDQDKIAPNEGNKTVRQVYEEAIKAIDAQIDEDKTLLDDRIQNVEATDEATYRLQTAGLLDAQSVSDAEAADREAERDQAIIDELGNDEDDENNEDPADDDKRSSDEVAGGSSVAFDGSSEGGFGTIGILAGIAAVIGLIAAAVPFLGNFIPNLPF